MFWKKKKHPLPKFPGAVRALFKAACSPLSSAEVKTLRSSIDRCIFKLRESVAENPTIDIKLAEEIAEVCCKLLDDYEDFSINQRSKIVGAVRYFAVAEDPFPDETFASGFDDDARVLNHVLEELGLEEYYIDLPNFS